MSRQYVYGGFWSIMAGRKKKQDILIGTLLLVVGSLLGGFLMGRGTAPEPSREEDVIVTESAHPDDAAKDYTAMNAVEASGEPTGSGKGYTQIVDIMDNMRHVVEERFVAANGRLALSEDGYAVIRKKYDSAGNTIKVSYFDEQDKPVMVEKLGYSSLAMTYDENNKKTSETYFDADGAAVIKAGQEYAGLRYTYDEAGNVTSESYYDAQVSPIIGPDGYHRAEYTYDEKKHVLTERYYGIENNLIVFKKGYAGADHRYDENGDNVRTAYYGADGKISENKDGTAIILRQYNEKHQVIQEEYRGG